MSAKIVFSSRDMPPALSDVAKFKLWRDIYVGEIAGLEIGVAPDTPFFADMTALPIGEVLLTSMEGTITGVERTARHIAADNSGDFCLLLNTGTAAMGGMFRGQETAIGVGGAALQTFAEPLQLRGGQANSWTNLIIPRASLLRRFGDIESRLAKEIGPGNEAMTMLSAYCQMIERIGVPSTPDLLVHTTNTVLDLVGLASGASGETAELAGMRGLRSARVLAIIARINLRYADPNFGAAEMAAELQLSPRYVQELLQETGIGFSQRVLELRLQKAFDMLADASFDHLRVAQIAYAAGFGDVSYFNRSFRRRFGCTPNVARSS